METTGSDDKLLTGGNCISKAELIHIAKDVVSELPESQRMFFRDLYGLPRSQYRVAQIYGISPQAVTNRIKKLKKTFEKKILERTGCSPEEIVEALYEKSLEQMIDDDVDAATKASRHETIKVNGVYKGRRWDAELMQMINESMSIWPR